MVAGGNRSGTTLLLLCGCTTTEFLAMSSVGISARRKATILLVSWKSIGVLCCGQNQISSPGIAKKIHVRIAGTHRLNPESSLPPPLIILPFYGEHDDNTA